MIKNHYIKMISNTSKLEYLFNIVRDKSAELRGKYRDEFDGQAFGQPIEKC